MLRLAIVDDHKIVGRVPRNARRRAGVRVEFEAASGEGGACSSSASSPATSLLDLSPPGQSGVDVLRAVRQRYPALKVLVLSGFPEERYALPMIRNGANGYLCKDCERDELIRAIRTVAQGGATSRRAPPSCSPTTWPGCRPALPHESLSGAGAAGLPAAGQGESVSGIADTLNLSVKTVSTYRSRLSRSLEVASNAELAAYAPRHGLITSPDAGGASQRHPASIRVPGRGRADQREAALEHLRGKLMPASPWRLSWGWRCRSVAVVAHPQVQHVESPDASPTWMAGVGVPAGVGEGFLDDAEQGQDCLEHGGSLVGSWRVSSCRAARRVRARRASCCPRPSSGGRRSSMMRRLMVIPEPMVSMRRRKRPDVGPAVAPRLRSSQLASILAAVRRAPSLSWSSRASGALGLAGIGEVAGEVGRCLRVRWETIDPRATFSVRAGIRRARRVAWRCCTPNSATMTARGRLWPAR